MDIKKLFRKRAPESDLEGSEDKSDHKNKRSRAQRKRIEKFLIIALVLIVLTAVIVIVLQRHVYHKYTMIASAKNEDVQSAGYEQMDDCILKYGTDGASLLNKDLKTIWTQSFEMTNPVADVKDGTAVVADKDGTLMYIFKKDKPVGGVQTTLPILKARVAQTGVVAAILQDGEKTWINFYATDGSLIAENQTRIDSPGYPVDLAVSPNGTLIMITYLYVENGQTTSYVAYYNFGDAGQSEIDNIVAGYTYEGVLVPQVVYLNDDVSLAFREDGYSVYKGGEVPKETTKKKIKSEIISTFYNEKYVGLVFKSESKNQKYTMQVFDLSGKEQFKRDFNLEYQNIKISSDMIIMNNESQISMYSLGGFEKFNGNVEEGSIKNIFRIASNRYVLVTDIGVKTIKLR